jgi:hypothetical protein
MLFAVGISALQQSWQDGAHSACRGYTKRMSLRMHGSPQFGGGIA